MAKLENTDVVEKTRPEPKAGTAGKNGGQTSSVEQKATPALSNRTPQDPRIRVPQSDFDNSARKFELEPTPSVSIPEPQVPEYEYLGELPQAYGTKKLHLVARDPYWLYACWDLTFEQIAHAQESAHDGKVFLQLYANDGQRTQQIQISPWSREWYLHVNQADARFHAEIGYYRQDGGFEIISRSGITATPRDTLSWRTDAQFVTIPMRFSYKDLFSMIEGHLLPDEDLAEALARLQRSGFKFPFEIGFPPELNEEAQRSLLEYMGGDFVRRIQAGSGEIVEIFRRRIQSELSSGQWRSSPFGASFGASFGARPREFFMHVNAELILYGGTDPKAKLRIDGKEIALGPDGAFSYHFNFNDGKYHIPIEATSPDGSEKRSALLSFLRLSEFQGDVEASTQTPRPEPLGKVD
ncbi:MAG: DUF4912 domain-containing protein [Methylacidiphilales bacterium]|nr:DUF4912 domain-containing protein [Candidatus Methylacidiphilales bacterium]